jgi:hypothetical protein
MEEEQQKGWQSISSTVKKDFYRELEKLAAQEGIKIGSFVRRAVRVCSSNEVQGVAAAMKLDVESLIKQSVLLFQRLNADKQENCLRDRIARLEIWIEKLFYHLANRNEGLMVQMRAEVERKMREFYKECQRDEAELRRQIMKTSGQDVQAASAVSPERNSGGPK